MQVLASTCWECSTCCGALLHVEDGRVGEVAPYPEHPASRGAFCIKGIRGMPGVAYGAERLLHPMRRTGARGEGRWERISWEAALDEMAERLDAVRAAHGPLALAAATSGAFFSRSVVVALLMRALGSPNWMINQDLCGGCRGVSDMVTRLGIAGGEDIDHARTLLLVGSNPHMANPIQWQRIREAKKRGARMIVIDPMRTQAAALADRWLRPLPGTDAAIGLAMMNVLVREGRHDKDFVARWCDGFDALAERVAGWTPARAAQVSGVPETEIVAAAREYADGPSCFVSGHGIDAMSNGVQTFRTFHCLLAITGNLDRPGGNRRAKRPAGFRSGFDVLHDPAFRLPPEVETQALGAARFPLWTGPEGWQGACHNPTVIEAMLTGKPYPVRALYVSGVNIAVTYPDTQRTLAALRSLDFLAVATHTMTPTAALADIVLPKTVTLEEEEVTVHPAGPCLAYTAPAHAPLGEARSDVEIAAGLLARMAHRPLMPWRTQREYNEFVLEKTGLSIDALREKGYLEFDWRHGDLAHKVELYSQRMAKHGLDPLPDWTPPAASGGIDADFPLRLQTGLRERTYHHSRFREQAWAKKVSPDPLATLHPSTAARLGVAEGDWICVSTRGQDGTCRLKAKLSEVTAPDTVVTGMGWWRPDAPGPEYGALDVNINAALSYGGPYDPASGSADTRGIPCRVVRLTAAGAG